MDFSTTETDLKDTDFKDPEVDSPRGILDWPSNFGPKVLGVPNRDCSHFGISMTVSKTIFDGSFIM